MNFTLDANAPSPLFRQLQDQIRYAISVGDLVPGDRLPSIRELEKLLGVNRNTVRRAYLELQLDGTLLVRQGREAIVADRPAATAPAEPDVLAASAASLTAGLLQRAEAAGLDSVQLADYVVRAAQEHDAAYPRCALLECSRRQASYLAEHVRRYFGRRIVGIDLHELRDDPAILPASVRYVLTPHWHAAEARELIDDRALFPIGVRLTAGCEQRLAAHRGKHVGLVVRDAESLPGFRDRVRAHVGANVTAVLAGDNAALAALIADADYLVCTSPCTDAVRGAASGTDVQELLFEPVPDDLASINQQIFPTLVHEMQPV